MQDEEMFIWGKNERKSGEFRYSMTITTSPLVTWPNSGLALVYQLGDTYDG